ncbi:MAG: His/Gly/Thr/Pro-type tRNA ligase C-terminal domain-containing protein, partial [Gemmatimonadota bacterium]
EQIEAEIADMLDLVDLVMGTFGFEYRYDLATRPEERIGEEAVWDQAEEALEGALEDSEAAFEVDEGGGAFYGPKIDIKFEDALGRDWQGATIQLDFVLPERFELEYIGSDNSPHRPVMIHRAILGTMERFVGGLIEHFAGAFPLWLAPEQVRVLPITDDEIEGAEEVAERLREADLRVSVDSQSDTLSYRIREAELEKIPYTLVVGQRELEAGTVAVRARGAEDKQVEMTVPEFLETATEQVESRALEPY